MTCINGKIVANVTIDVSANELSMALTEEFKIKELFMVRRNEYSKAQLIEEDGEKNIRSEVQKQCASWFSSL